MALLIETSNRYTRELLQGVREFMRREGDWAVHLTEHGRGDVPPPWLRRWEGDGVIARIENRRTDNAVRKLGIPVVNVSASGLATDFPTVISDSAGVARLAADHLIDAGFENFAYCGDARFAWSASHGRHFVERIEEGGHSCASFRSRAKDFTDWQVEQRRLSEWLVGLPKPVGIMACYDIRGQQVLDVCRAAGLRVPDDVGVIGQHDDSLLCDLCDPPLSSVSPNPQRAGFQAAVLLERLMSGRKVAAKTHTIAPMGVTSRLSTDLVSTRDPDVALAMRYIRAHAMEGIGVDDLLRLVPLSRTALERKFKAILNRSPYDAILQVRFDKAKELLAKTDLPVGEIAERTGFATAEYFSASFKVKTGVSPRGYARQSRASTAD